MGLFQEIFRICETRKPRDEECWTYSNGRIVVDWARAPELREPCGAIRIEGAEPPERLLVIYGIDGQFHAFRNRCTDMNRRLDPVPGKPAVRCCCLFRSTFDYTGNVMSGPAKESLKTYPVEAHKCKMIIRLG